MASNFIANYAAEAQAGTKSKSEQQPVRGGDYVAQGQLDYRAARDIGAGDQKKAPGLREIVVKQEARG
jgi:hypothetical protein